MDVKKLRLKSGMTQKAFSEYFGIPKRTIGNWEVDVSSPEHRDCPKYLFDLMVYKLDKEGLLSEEKSE